MAWRWKQSKKKKRKVPTEYPGRFAEFERYGQSILSNLSEAAKEEPWLLKVTAIAWTAGPVTCFGLYFSYYAVYGKWPDISVLFYFGLYTGLTGVISIFSRILSKATTEKQRQEDEKTLLEVSSMFPDLIMALKNEQLAQYDDSTQQQVAATMILEDPDASEGSLITAIENLLGIPEVADRIRRIETYRKKGFFSVIQRESETFEMDYKQELEDLQLRNPKAAFLVKERMQGRRPSKKIGKARKPGFLRRLFEAQDHQSLSMLDLSDLEEFLKVTLELLLGRRFFVLRWKAFGNHPLAESARRRDKARNRIYQNRFKIFKARRDLLDLLRENRPQFTETLEYQFFADEQNAEKFKSKIEQIVATDPPEEFEPALNLAELQMLTNYHIKELRSALTYHETVLTRYQIIQKSFEDLRREYGQEIPLHLYSRQRPGTSGIRFDSELVRLTSEQRIELGRKLHAVFNKILVRSDRTKILWETDDDGDRPLTQRQLKLFCLEVLDNLMNYLPTREPAIMDSLESSFGIHVISIEWGLSKKTKFGWLAAGVDEIGDYPQVTVARTVQRLLRYFYGELSRKDLDYLEKEFKLDLDRFNITDFYKLLPQRIDQVEEEAAEITEKLKLQSAGN